MQRYLSMREDFNHGKPLSIVSCAPSAQAKRDKLSETLHCAQQDVQLQGQGDFRASRNFWTYVCMHLMLVSPFAVCANSVLISLITRFCQEQPQVQANLWVCNRRNIFSVSHLAAKRPVNSFKHHQRQQCTRTEFAFFTRTECDISFHALAKCQQGEKIIKGNNFTQTKQTNME